VEKREDRRDKSIRYGERARAVHMRVVHPDGTPDCICEQSAWWFAKRKSLGCNCRRRWPGRPKLALSLCHGAGRYHPSVVERIAGGRLAHAWLRELRGARDADDVELRGRERLTRGG
jgi:hypothetical protein